MTRWEERVAEAERQFRDAERKAEEQVVLIEELAAVGRDTKAAESILGTYLAIIDNFAEALHHLRHTHANEAGD
jgi:hypothetical protein